jgi:hypothetical protein
MTAPGMAATTDPKERGRASRDLNAARKAMLDAVREAGKLVTAGSRSEQGRARGRGGGGLEGGGRGGEADDEDDCDVSMEFDAVLMEREVAFISLCRRAGGVTGSPHPLA